jgi:hypothetical protein
MHWSFFPTFLGNPFNASFPHLTWDIMLFYILITSISFVQERGIYSGLQCTICSSMPSVSVYATQKTPLCIFIFPSHHHPDHSSQIIFNVNPHCTHRLAKNSNVPTTIVNPQNICRYRKPPLSCVSRAPPIGLPVKPAKATQRKNVPERTPISRIGEICAMSEGARETNAPDENP